MEKIRTSNKAWLGNTININNIEVEFDDKGFAEVNSPEEFIKSFPEKIFLPENFEEGVFSEETKNKSLNSLRNKLKSRDLKINRLNKQLEDKDKDITVWKDEVQKLQRELDIIKNTHSDNLGINLELNDALFKKSIPELKKELFDLKVTEAKRNGNPLTKKQETTLERTISKFQKKDILVGKITEMVNE